MLVMMVIIIMMMMNCFCGMVERHLCHISSWDHCQRFSWLQISDMPQVGLLLLTWSAYATDHVFFVIHVLFIPKMI